MTTRTTTRSNSKKKVVGKLETFHPVANEAEWAIILEQPFIVRAVLQGTAPFLFHRWSNESVAAKGAAAKGSKAKKEDDIESYVYRTPDGELAIPGEYFRMAIVGAAKFRQDPRSPRKSAMDLFKAGVVPLDELCGLGSKDWDYLDKRRVMVQRNGITRTRPAMNAEWQVTATFQVLLPEYIPPIALYEALQGAGRFIGVGDFRPTYGRFVIVRFDVEQ